MELGAGGGTVGMALARLGATVTVSDIPAMLPVLEFNVARNFKCSNSCSSSDGPITVMEHCWGEKLNGGPYDMGG